jgi:hypothetical protein
VEEVLASMVMARADGVRQYVEVKKMFITVNDW